MAKQITATTPLEVLLEVRELLGEKTKWTKRRMFRYANGIQVSRVEYALNAPELVGSMCLLGAITMSAGDLPQYHQIAAGAKEQLERSAGRLFDGDEVTYIDRLLEFNDEPETTYERVVEVIDDAIRQETLCEQRR